MFVGGAALAPSNATAACAANIRATCSDPSVRPPAVQVQRAEIVAIDVELDRLTACRLRHDQDSIPLASGISHPRRMAQAMESCEWQRLNATLP